MKQLYLFFVFIFISMPILAQTVNIPDANFKAAIIASGIDTSGDGEIQVNEAQLVTDLFVNSKSINDLTGIESFINLTSLFCENNILTSLDLSNNTTLEEIFANNNAITSVNFGNDSILNFIELGNNQLTSLDLSSLEELANFRANNNNLTSVIIGYKPNFDSFDFAGNQLTSIDFSMIGANILDLISVSDNLLTEIIFDSSNTIFFGGGLYLDNNEFTSLDLSNIITIDLFCSNNLNLEYLNLKNGSNNSFNNDLIFQNNPNLSYLCVDQDRILFFEQALIDNGYSISDIEINSYCSFVPGGEFYTIEGEAKVDINNDGCDNGDFNYPNLQFNIDDGTTTGSIIANGSEGYSIALQQGTYTITPTFENPSYWTVTPSSFIVNFPTDGSPVVQNICLEPNVIYSDLEITVLALGQARPGFDAYYKLLYKNKGNNTMLNGNVNLAFQGDVMDVISTNPNPDTQTGNELSWSFSNLLPLETREILFTMNLNTPTQTPPLNGNDILVYTATVSPVTGDETPDDNMHIINQTVVNSFDPNDKTCLEGATITLDQVGKYVHYMIRFENTGTASAINVVVKDEIDMTKYNMSTFIPLDGSHEFVTRINDSNSVEFIFENINLPFDDANNDGYVVFKIKTLSTLQSGDTFSNDAEIYFDFNAPIITNDELTSVDETLSIEEAENQDLVSIYPNPVNDNVGIESRHLLESVTVYDVNGRLIQEHVLTGNRKVSNIDLSSLLTGLYFMTIETNKGIINKRLIKN